ncbi:MAG: aspartyl/asparaginyl beta-hydroxylase domain-containing protein, partial [Gammaproteobacteria bacterium]
INDVYRWFEDNGLMRKNPAYIKNYHRDYRGLKELEANHALVQQECLQLLDIKERLTDVRALGAGYTEGGIHTAQWKAFMFKSGDFIDENCRLAPQTAALIRRIPGVYTAFFSVLYPHQVITPHWGYYKGFLRYHLGVIIPGNNQNNQCWLRVNGNQAQNDLNDKDQIVNGERYYWKNGEGMIFDDNYLHDAANESDEIRVVLWLDLRRRMPFYVGFLNRLCLWLVYRDSSVEKIRRGAVIGAEGVVNYPA